MRHKILAIIHRCLVVAVVTPSCTGNHNGKCPKCGGLNQCRNGWYGCWECEMEYSIEGLQWIEAKELKAAEYSSAV